MIFGFLLWECLLGQIGDTGQPVWMPPKDLDVFFGRMYTFFHERGFAVIATKRVTSLVCVPAVSPVVSHEV